MMKKCLDSLRIADVELFLGAAKAKNLGKAALLNHLSQSAASAAIMRVEKAFGMVLCTHEKRQFRLSRDGQLLLPRLENWLKQLHDLTIPEDQIPLRLVTTHAIAQIAIPHLLNMENVDFIHMRPDHAFAAVLRNEADIALVLDNAPWQGVIVSEVGRGKFQLYCKEIDAPKGPVLLPEDQMEVLELLQSWQQVHETPLPIKARIPSWSLIANICAGSKEIGFLPEFLGRKFKLHPVLWQVASSQYRVLALYRNTLKHMEKRIDRLIKELRSVFSA